MVRVFFTLIGLFCLALVGWLIYDYWTTPPKPAKLQIVESVDLAVAELGQVVKTDVVIRNLGDLPLSIHSIRSSCSCLGFEQTRDDGKLERVDSLSIPSGSQKSLIVRLVVNGTPGDAFQGVVMFSTNDPLQSEAKLPIVVRMLSAGVRAIPNVVSFNQIKRPGSQAHVVRIVDYSPTPRSIDRVAVMSPTGVVAVLTKLDQPESQPDGGHLIGLIEVKLEDFSPRTLDTRISVWLSSDTAKSPVSIQIIGTIPEPFELTPAALMLPFQSSEGPIYSAMLLCKFSGEVTSLKVTRVTGGYVAEVLKPTGPNLPYRIQISHPKPGSIQTNSEVTVSAQVDGKNYTRTVKINCSESNSK